MSEAMMRTIWSRRACGVPGCAMMLRSRLSSSRAPVGLPLWLILPLRPPRTSALAVHQGRDRFRDHVCDDVAGRLLLGNHADALTCHNRAALDIAVDHRAAQGTCPEMLDLTLRRLHIDGAAVEPVDHLALHLVEFLDAVVDKRPYRNDRKARIELHR